jgi:hypothetical protein
MAGGLAKDHELQLIRATPCGAFANSRLLAARDDLWLCCCGKSGPLYKGSPSVLLGRRPVARQGEPIGHRGARLLGGASNVLVGDLEETLLERGGGACAFVLNPDRALRVGPGARDPVRAPRSDVGPLCGPSPITHSFPGGDEQLALAYTVQVGDKTVVVIVPDEPCAAGEDRPTAEEVRDALALLGDAELQALDRVVVSPDRNPADGEWEGTYGIPSFASAASCGERTATFYPVGQERDAAEYGAELIHEAGHAVHQQAWEDPEVRKAWQRAARSDGRTWSGYADSGAMEDFAETVLLYRLVEGTPCEALARSRFPARFAALDELVGPTHR